MEEFVRTARAADTPPQTLARLTRAEELAQQINSKFTHRQQREASLSTLLDTARELALRSDLDSLLNVVTRRTRLLLNLGMSWVAFHDVEDGNSYVRAVDGHASSITVGFRIPDAGGLGNTAVNQGAPVWSSDYLSDEQFPHSGVIDGVVRAEGLRSLIAIPLVTERSRIGVLYGSDRNVRHFSPEEIALMSALSDLASVAIEQVRMTDQVRSKAAELEFSTDQAMRAYTSARQDLEFHGRMTDLLLGGCSLSTLLAEAANQLDAALVVRDPMGRDLASTADLSGADEADLADATLDALASGELVRAGDRLWVHPINADQERLGTLILRADSSPAGHQLGLLPSTARTVAVLLLMQRSTTAAEGQVRDDFLRDLLSASASPEQLEERGRRLSVDLAQPHVVVVVRPEGGTQGRAVVWASAHANRLSGLTHVVGGCIVLLLPGTDADAAAQAIVKELTTVLGHPVTAGSAGPMTGAGAVQRTYQEARRCLEALTVLGCTGTAGSKRKLGFLGLLLSDNCDVTSFIQDTLGSVLDYDVQQGTDLLRTLNAYFAAGNSPTRAAEALHVHTNTVARRLERISELLDGDWQEPGRALEIQLALRLHRVRHILRPKNPTEPPKRPAERGGK
ncbi:helix-turn-helix domain-containing protein [Streptacidiphilus fuscans]|nr:helix-turn-helix domain-containing protein [Streptacidiphilus fuscans]